MAYDSNWTLLNAYTFSASAVGTAIPTAYPWLGEPYTGSTNQLPSGSWEDSLAIVGTSGTYSHAVANCLNLMTDGTNSAGIAVASGSDFTYGRVEVTAYADHDPSAGGGVPCIGLWPVDQNWPTEIEIDMIEMPNTWYNGSSATSNPRSFISTTDNYGTGYPIPIQFLGPAGTLVNGVAFDGGVNHVYACECMPTGMTCWIDGQLILQVTGPTIAIPWTPHQLFMQMALIDSIGSSSNIGLHVSEVKFFAANGPSAVSTLRCFQPGGQGTARYRF